MDFNTRWQPGKSIFAVAQIENAFAIE